MERTTLFSKKRAFKLLKGQIAHLRYESELDRRARVWRNTHMIQRFFRELPP